VRREAGIELVLARAIRAERVRAGLSQLQLAERLSAGPGPGLSRQTVTNIESGRRGILLRDLVAICTALGVTLAELARDAADQDRRSLGLPAVEQVIESRYRQRRVETTGSQEHAMPTIPRIDRAVPHGDVTRAEQGLPVWALICWRDAAGIREEEVPAIAVAWTREAVQVEWESRSFGRQIDWLPAAYIWRQGQPRPANPRWAPRARG
jgi:transcriptional regulator with XRE-family HTH domain